MGNKFVTILMMYTIIHASLLKDNVINVHAACLCGRFPVGYFSSKYDWLRPDIHSLQWRRATRGFYAGWIFVENIDGKQFCVLLFDADANEIRQLR